MPVAMRNHLLRVSPKRPAASGRRRCAVKVVCHKCDQKNETPLERLNKAKCGNCGIHLCRQRIVVACHKCDQKNETPLERISKAKCGNCGIHLYYELVSQTDAQARKAPQTGTKANGKKEHVKWLHAGMIIMALGLVLIGWDAHALLLPRQAPSCTALFKEACNALERGVDGRPGDLAHANVCRAWALEGLTPKEISFKKTRDDSGHEAISKILQNKVRDAFKGRSGYEGFQACWDTHASEMQRVGRSDRRSAYLKLQERLGLREPVLLEPFPSLKDDPAPPVAPPVPAIEKPQTKEPAPPRTTSNISKNNTEKNTPQKTPSVARADAPVAVAKATPKTTPVSPSRSVESTDFDADFDMADAEFKAWTKAEKNGFLDFLRAVKSGRPISKADLDKALGPAQHGGVMPEWTRRTRTGRCLCRYRRGTPPPTSCSDHRCGPVTWDN